MSAVLVFVFVICLLHFILSKYKLYRTGWQIPGPWALPLMGNVQMITKLKPQTLFLNIIENRKRFKRSYRLWLGPQLWVFLHSPLEAREALNDASLVKPDTFKQLHLLLGNGLLISEGQFWQSHRRALGPAFQPNILHSFTPAISAHAEVLLQKLSTSAGQSVEVSEYLFPCVLDAIIDTSMGKKLNSQNDPHDRYSQAFHNASELLFKRMMNPLLSYDFIFQRTSIYSKLQKSLSIIFGLMETVIEERAAYLRQQSEASKSPEVTGRRARTLLDTLLTSEIDERPLSFQQVRDEVNTFVFAGVDTTTAAMSFVLYALAKYPTEQIKLCEEIKNQLPALSAESPLTISDLNSLSYLDLFLKECLRYYTIVPLTGRQTTTDTKIGNIRYCAGVTIWINMYGLAHDAELFDNPEEFRPERFSKEQLQRIPAFAYIPFSGGPHVCIGKKYALLIMKILTVKILLNFEISLSNPGEQLVLMAQMVLKSLYGIHLKFKPRELKI